MKKRVISLMLAVAMLLSMASSLTVSVRAASKNHYCFEGSALCEELPAAYRAMQVEDAENFFVTWINLYQSYDPESEEYGYDAANFRKGSKTVCQPRWQKVSTRRKLRHRHSFPVFPPDH